MRSTNVQFGSIVSKNFIVVLECAVRVSFANRNFVTIESHTFPIMQTLAK
jgi:hypothetical protein